MKSIDRLNLRFNPETHHLGQICRYTHEWGNTGQSLRNRRGDCVDCQRIANQDYRKRRGKQELSQKVEKQRLLTLDLLQQVFDPQPTDHPRKRNIENYYLGKLCINQHSYQGTGYSLRLLIGSGCADCHKEAGNRHRQSKSEEIKAKRKQYRLNNLEKARIYDAQQYWKHVEEKREKAREWGRQNPEKVRQKHLEYRRKNLEKIEKYDAAYRSINSERISQRRREKYQKNKLIENESHKQWTRNNIEHVRAYNSKRRSRKRGVHQAPYTVNELNLRLAEFGSVCAYCQNKPHKHWDHFLPIALGGSESLNNLVPSCESCNSSKRHFDPLEWYRRQSFYSQKQWRKILKVLGKTEATYNQIPLL